MSNGPRNEDSPHFGIPGFMSGEQIGLDGKPLRTIVRKKSPSANENMDQFFPDIGVSRDFLKVTEKEEKIYKLRFARGSWYFGVEFGAPRSIREAKERKAGELIFDEDLQIDPENLSSAKIGERIVIKVKRKDITALFGPFVKVYLLETEEDGEVVKKGPYLVSLEDRSGLDEIRKRKGEVPSRKTDALRF